MRTTLLICTLCAGLLLGGCDSDGSQRSTVTIGFRLDAQNSLAAKALEDDLIIGGSNGTLRISDVRLIAEEFKLKRLSDDDCDSLSGEDHEICEEFELPPFFVDLPLDESRVVVASGDIPADTYRELEFEIENLDDDDDDGQPAVAAALLDQIREDFPDWPRKASLLVVGEFDSGSGPQAFRIYVDAEIEIELGLNPPLMISSDGISADITIILDPAAWFRRADGTVLNLSDGDFSNTGELFEFEVDIEDGFKAIEFED